MAPTPFLRCKSFWIPRITLQMCSERENYDTKAGLGALEGFVSRFVTLITAKQPDCGKNPCNLRLTRQRVRYISDSIFSCEPKESPPQAKPLLRSANSPANPKAKCEFTRKSQGKVQIHPLIPKQSLVSPANPNADSKFTRKSQGKVCIL